MLGPYLGKTYGHGGTYSAAQINVAVQRLGLPEKYICFGYAAFATKEIYQDLADTMPIFMPRHEALSLFDKYKPSTPYSASANPPPRIGL